MLVGVAATAVYIEPGKHQVFACALDWPGWCRRSKDEGAALAALGSYAGRYARVAGEAGLGFPSAVADGFHVVERLPVSPSVDFGALDRPATRDGDPLTGAEAQRQMALVDAAWRLFDQVVGRAPAQLRKGPRGGGRDRDLIVDHVLGAEVAYARKIGVRFRQPEIDDQAAIGELRDAIRAVLEQPSDGMPAIEGGWLPRYALRRIAWHVLDHAWEIEDRGPPAAP
jgi:hypothetical protein